MCKYQDKYNNCKWFNYAQFYYYSGLPYKK